MSNHFADAIVVLSRNIDSAEAIKKTINLRGFDQVLCGKLDDGAALLQQNQPDLLLIEPQGDTITAQRLLKKLKSTVSVIYLADRFEEEQFFTTFDAGARDYLVKPVPDAYLMSRVLIALENQRTQQRLDQQQRVLLSLGAIGQDSKVFTTNQFIKLIKEEVIQLSRHNEPMLSLLMLQLTNNNTDVKEKQKCQKKLYADVAEILLKTCRGNDITGEYFEDKFAVLFPKTLLNGAKSAAKRIEKEVKDYIQQYQGSPNQLELAIGVADFEDCLHYEDLLNKTSQTLKQKS